MLKCTGQDGCEVHPHIRTRHPVKPVGVEYDNADTATLDYSDAWEQAEAEWERLSQSESGRAMLKAMTEAVHGRDYQ